jgi:hypothetical protein
MYGTMKLQVIFILILEPFKEPVQLKGIDEEEIVLILRKQSSCG